MRRTTSCVALALAALGTTATSARAQVAVPTVPAAQPDTALVVQSPAVVDSASLPAPLVVQNRQVFLFRAPLGASTPVERAAAARQRIDRFVETHDAGSDADSVTLTPLAEGVLVRVGGASMFTITPADADSLAGEQLATLATATAVQLRSALAAAREQRSIPHLLWAIGFALLATVLFIVVLRALRWLRVRLQRRLPPSAAGRLPDLRVANFTVLSADSVLAVGRRLVDLAVWVAGLFAAYVWLAFVLTRFVYSRPWGEALGAYLATTISQLLLAALAGIPGLFTVVLIIVATRWVTRLVGTFFDAVEAGGVETPWVHPETANATKRIVVTLLWLFAIVVAYPYVPGSGSDVFKGVSVFAGLVLSLGSSGIVNQAMSGLVLTYSRALKPGDYVRIGEIEGTVTSLGMLSTKIRSLKQEEITLPNAVVVTNNVRNFTRLAGEGGIILHTAVTIGYDVPWRQVRELLLLAARRTEGLRTSTPPFVLQTALSDFYVEYQLNAYLDTPERRVPTLSALHANIVDAFNEYGVQILSPHFVANPATPAVVPPDGWYRAPATPPTPPTT